MARRATKRDEILAEARKRLEAALSAAKDADAQAEQATAVAGVKWSIAGALETEYKALEKALAPKPRQQPAATKGTAGSKRISGGGSKKKQEQPRADALCAYTYPDNSSCRYVRVTPIHDPNGGYAGYHPFVLPAQPVTPQLPPNGAGAGSGASSETPLDVATSAAHAASEGG